MGKALPILGIVGAAFAAFSLLGVLRDLAGFIVIPIVLAGSIVLVAQRNVAGVVAGLVALGLLVFAALGAAGSVATKDKGSFDVSEGTGLLLGAIAYLAIPVGAIASRWGRMDPAWWTWVGLGCAGLSALVGLIARDDLAVQTKPLVLAAAVLALAVIAPMVVLLRAGDDEPVAPPPTMAAR